MIVLHIAPINTERVNGFRFSVPALVNSQNEFNSDVNSSLASISKFEINKIQKTKLTNFFEDIDKFEPPFNKPDIVIFHGVYFLKYLKLSKQLKEKKIPYLIVPRVSLTEGAQSQKKLKKVLGNILLFNNFIKGAQAIHYLTKNEYYTSKRMNRKNGEYFISGNGCTILNEKEKPISSKKKFLNVTFLGRFDINHKGLDLLIESIKDIKSELMMNNVKFNLYGSDYKNNKQILMDKITEYNISEIVTLHNPIFDEMKKKVLTESDLFIAPSRFEGHPMAVIEALSYGIPCIVTKNTNVLDLILEYNAGWEIQLNKDDISKVLKEVILINSYDIKEKQNNAMKLAKENYSWEMISKQTIKIYSDLLNK